MDDISKIFEFAMNLELRGMEFYKNYKDQVKNKAIKELFEGLEDMEKNHYEILKDQLEGYKKSNNKENFEFALCKPCADKIFEENNKKIEKTDYDFSDMSILRMAYLIENDFADFYNKACEKTKNQSAKNLLKTLESWEHEHKDSLLKQYNFAMQNNWFDQSFAPF